MKKLSCHLPTEKGVTTYKFIPCNIYASIIKTEKSYCGFKVFNCSCFKTVMMEFECRITNAFDELCRKDYRED